MREPQFNLDALLLDIARSDLNDSQARDAMRKLAMRVTRCTGVAHIIRDPQNVWQLNPAHVTGRVALQEALGEAFADRCNEVFLGDGIQSQPVPGKQETVALLAPVRSRSAPAELLVVVVANKDAAKLVSPVKRIVVAIELWLKNVQERQSHWKLQSLAALSELVSRIQRSDTVQKAAENAVNEMAACLECSHVAFGVITGRKMKLLAVSGVHKMDRGSETSRAFRDALRESQTRDAAGLFPAVEDDNNHLLVAHRQLATTVHGEAICSQPLKSDDDELVGAWLFVGDREKVLHPRLAQFVSAASPKVATSVKLLQRAQRTRLARAVSFLQNKVSLFTRLMIPIAIAAVVVLMLMPVTYRVRCNGVAEPVARRFAVAPFDGLVVSGFAEPGDIVQQDEVLAEIDGRSVRWELSGVTAERRQSQRQREIELASGNIPKTFLAEFENERLASQEKILQFKRDHLQVKSPIDGVVLSGSLERAVAASITTGQVLFEIGPLQPIKVEIAVPAEDIAQVETGHEVTIWIEGQEDEPLAGKIARIHPRSETRDARNIFVAELEFPNKEERLRPGMKGSVRIDCEQRSLGWCLFHKPVNYLRSRLTWW